MSNPLRLPDLLELWDLPRHAGMNALSILQPHASMFALGERVIESRDWFSKYRGPIAIASSARWERDELEAASQEPAFLKVWARHRIGGPRDLPLGAVLCVAMLIDVVAGEEVEHAFDLAFDRRNATDLPTLPDHRAVVAGVTCAPFEHQFGSYGLERTGFVFGDVHRLVVPVPCKGRQGLWGVGGDLRAALERTELVRVAS